MSTSRTHGHSASQPESSSTPTPSIVYVDLAGTTFMGSTLVAFLVHVGNDGQTRRPLVLCRPTPMALRVIQMTGLDELATVRPDLPPVWPDALDQPLSLMAG